MPDDDILREYLPWLRVVAGNLIGFGNPDLPDLVQEGYIAMWRALKSHNAEVGPLDWWLKYKAQGRMKTVAIRAADRPAFDELMDDIAAPDLLERIDSAYHHGEVAAAVDRLSPQQKRYVIARFWLGLSGREMVEMGVFKYDPSALWNSKRNGARWKLQKELAHLQG